MIPAPYTTARPAPREPYLPRVPAGPVPGFPYTGRDARRPADPSPTSPTAAAVRDLVVLVSLLREAVGLMLALQQLAATLDTPAAEQQQAA